jgi:hypothetical protein
MPRLNPGMNGIVSESTPRFQSPKNNITNLVSAVICLMGGMIFGMNQTPVHFKLFQHIQKQEISFEKISWISGQNLEKLQFTSSQPVQEGIPFEFKSYEDLKPSKHQRKYSKTIVRTGQLERLESELDQIESHTRDDFSDFKFAMLQLRGDFNSLEEQKNSTTLPRRALVAHYQVSPKPKSFNPQLAAVQLKRSDNKNTQNLNNQAQINPESIKQTLSSANPEFEEAKITVAPSLTESQKRNLSAALLGLRSTQSVRQAQVLASRSSPRRVAKPDPSLVFDPIVEAEPVSLADSKSDSCGLGSALQFEKPINSPSEGLSTQVCPERLEWISNNHGLSQWVKVTGSQHLTTLTLSPAPNHGSTLLIDENSLAAIALRSGTRVARGTGAVLGTVPKGYKINFVGRGEETEYFDSLDRKYFAVLNAEPGAGVLELVSDKDPNATSTVFTPVLEDTVTYLDLSAPEKQDLSIKVVKHGTLNDPEVSGLTVGIATQNSIQAITRQDGVAVLKEVSLVPGFPVFVDVGSKYQNDSGYIYRYELEQRTRSGNFLVHQIAESSLNRWLKQVKQGLSDQGAMVVGSFNRKKLDGFKNLYHVAVEPITAKFGLEPINYSILWNGKISETEPLEGDLPRFMSVQVSEGLSRVKLVDESKGTVQSRLLPVSPRVIHVVTE